MHSSVFPLLVEFALAPVLAAVDDYGGIALSQTRSSRSVFLIFFTIITEYGPRWSDEFQGIFTDKPRLTKVELPSCEGNE